MDGYGKKRKRTKASKTHKKGVMPPALRAWNKEVDAVQRQYGLNRKDAMSKASQLRKHGARGLGLTRKHKKRVLW